jgi:hypothetical protein
MPPKSPSSNQPSDHIADEPPDDDGLLIEDEDETFDPCNPLAIIGDRRGDA